SSTESRYMPASAVKLAMMPFSLESGSIAQSVHSDAPCICIDAVCEASPDHDVLLITIPPSITSKTSYDPLYWDGVSGVAALDIVPLFVVLTENPGLTVIDVPDMAVT